MEVPEGAHNYTAHLFSIQAKKLTRNAEEIYGIHHFAAAVTQRYPLSARWRWQNSVCFSHEVCDLIQDMWRSNPLWGSPRIVGELRKLGITVAKSTVEKYR